MEDDEIAKNTRMKSRFDNFEKEGGWLPCCYGGWSDMNLRLRCFSA